jgi:hypothetical protein
MASGPNLYSYAGEDPLGSTDATGFQEEGTRSGAVSSAQEFADLTAQLYKDMANTADKKGCITVKYDVFKKWFKNHGHEIGQTQLTYLDTGCVGLAFLMQNNFAPEKPYELGKTGLPQFSSHCFDTLDNAKKWVQEHLSVCPHPFYFAMQGVWMGGHKPTPKPGGVLYPHQISGGGPSNDNFNYVSFVGGYAMYMSHAVVSANASPVTVTICPAAGFTLPHIRDLEATEWCVCCCESKGGTGSPGDSHR